MSRTIYDAVIIGGGIVGAACADALARERLRTIVVERDLVSSGATGAGMGHLVVMDDSEAQFRLTRYSQTLWMELQPDLPADVEYRRCGTLWIAADDNEMQEVARKHAYYSARGVPVEILDPKTLAEVEPNLRPGLSGALLVAEDAAIDPPCAARFLIERARLAGAELLTGVSVSSIDGRAVWLSNGVTLSTGVIVNAAGIDAGALSPDAAVRKRKGHLVITDFYPGFVQHQLIELGYLKSAHSIAGDSVAFNVQPRATGQLLIGSSRQYEASDTRVDDVLLARMLRRAIDYMPALSEVSTARAWTGFRAATHDRLPLIGRSTANHFLFLATGHEGLGITTSLATAALVADQVMDRTPAIPPEPYLPSRVSLDHAHA